MFGRARHMVRLDHKLDCKPVGLFIWILPQPIHCSSCKQFIGYWSELNRDLTARVARWCVRNEGRTDTPQGLRDICGNVQEYAGQFPTGNAMSIGRHRNSNQSWAFIGMRELPFPYVTLTDQFGQVKNITSVAEASVWLVAHWPIRNSEKLQAAKLACLDALAGKATCTDCRNAFKEAAKEAGIYVTHKRL